MPQYLSFVVFHEERFFAEATQNNKNFSFPLVKVLFHTLSSFIIHNSSLLYATSLIQRASKGTTKR